ncbi:sugar transporter [Thermoanaerobacter sp. YS13]|uniref:PRD domain-containing protein n=1 Tax=Thermoanaerobacter sp. YS13 TaxID=1511746 RepID=UPI0005752C68|nr:PRD domain-containing protein [Thermoanaerobacter sp. YS13]KHO61388.1 sugar transporter [Thermoanaerobacter sp. YS13]
MKDNVLNRIDLLVQGSVIDFDTGEAIKKIDEELRVNYEICTEDEHYEMFITHLAMSIKRLKEKEKLESTIDDELFNEVKNSPNYYRALGILQNIEDRIEIKLPESEKRFVLLHLCNLLERGKST